MIEDMRILRK